MLHGLYILSCTHTGSSVYNELNSAVKSNFDTYRKRELIIIWMTNAHLFTWFERFMQLAIGISDKGHNFDEKFNGTLLDFYGMNRFSI